MDRHSRLRGWLAVAGLVAALGAGCDSRAGEDSVDDASSVPASPTTTVREPTVTPNPDVLAPDSRIVQKTGWIENARPVRSSLPTRVDVAKLAVAPNLHERPIDDAVLAVGTSSFTNRSPLPPGAVALIGADAELRQILLDEVGVRRPSSEQEFALNPSGTMLALGDRGGVVIVSLKDGTHRRYPSAVLSPVAIQWAPEGDRLIYAERHGGRGYELGLTSGKTTRASFNPAVVAPGIDGTALGFTADDGPVASVRHWRGQRRNGDVPLETTVQPDGPPAWRTKAAFTQRYGRLDGHNSATGFVVFDPASGSFDAVLPVPVRYLSYGGAEGWWGASRLVLSIQVKDGGGIYAWDYKNRSVRQLCELNGPGMLLSLAQDNLSPN